MTLAEWSSQLFPVNAKLIYLHEGKEIAQIPHSIKYRNTVDLLYKILYDFFSFLQSDILMQLLLDW